MKLRAWLAVVMFALGSVAVCAEEKDNIEYEIQKTETYINEFFSTKTARQYALDHLKYALSFKDESDQKAILRYIRGEGSRPWYDEFSSRSASASKATTEKHTGNSTILAIIDYFYQKGVDGFLLLMGWLIVFSIVYGFAVILPIRLVANAIAKSKSSKYDVSLHTAESASPEDGEKTPVPAAPFSRFFPLQKKHWDLFRKH